MGTVPAEYVSNEATTYTYDNDGRLVKEHIVTTYDDLSTEVHDIHYLYDDSGIIGMVKDGTGYYFHRNIQGDVVGVYNSSGTKLVTFKYDAYGNCSVSGDASLASYCKIRYRGYYFDTETGLYWVQTRYYNPQWCRWISPDTLDYLNPETAHGLNLYAYCGNDPVNYYDPSGHSALLALGIFALSSLAMWGVSELFGSQIAGGIGSIGGGATAISTGISLCAFGPWGIVAGIALMAVGGLTIAFGANEIVDGVTGTNYIQNWTGWSDEVYNGVYIGLNVASAVGSIAGNIGMRIASNHILKGIVNNPESVQQYRLWQLKTYGKYTTQYVPGTLRKGEHIGQGYTLTHVKGGPNGYIQWHPGSRHHYNGLPYWKVTSALGGTWRGLYLF